MDAKEQVKQLHAQLEQKQNTIDSLTEQTQLLGGFKAEALNGREKIAGLEEKSASLEQKLAQAVKEASDAKSAASSASSSSAADAKKVAAATDLANAIKILLGS